MTGLIENIIKKYSIDVEQGLYIDETLLPSYSHELFTQSFFESIVLFPSIDGNNTQGNLSYSFFLEENNTPCVQHIIYADLFHKYMIEEVPVGRKYFFGRIAFDPGMFYSCYNLLNFQVEELNSQDSACVYHRSVPKSVPINKEQCINVDDEYIHIPLYLEHSKVKNGSIFTGPIKTDDELKILSFRIKNTLPIKKDIRSEYPVLFTLIISAMFETKIFEPTNKDFLIPYKPGYTGSLIQASRIFDAYKLPSINTILQLSAAKYEGTQNCGAIDFYIDEATSFNDESEITSLEKAFDDLLRSECEVIFTDQCDIKEINVRELRKYVEMSSSDMPIVAVRKLFRMCLENKPVSFYSDLDGLNDWKVFGLKRKDKTGAFAKLVFLDHLKWRIEFKNKEIVSYDGVYFTFKHDEPRNDSVEKISFITEEQRSKIFNIIKKAQRQTHGTMLVFTGNAEAEAERLGTVGRAIRIEKIDFANFPDDYIFRITSIDGAVLLDFDGNGYAIGAILDGIAVENSNRGRGARYNSGYTYVKNQEKNGTDCICVVISEDRSTDIIASQRSSQA